MILTLFFNKKYRILTLYININIQKKKREKAWTPIWGKLGPSNSFPPSTIGPMESTGATDNLPDICSVQRAKRGVIVQNSCHAAA
jgi:hypothetical protein